MPAQVEDSSGRPRAQLVEEVALGSRQPTGVIRSAAADLTDHLSDRASEHPTEDSGESQAADRFEGLPQHPTLRPMEHLGENPAADRLKGLTEHPTEHPAQHLIEPTGAARIRTEDRWHWRRRIRADPRKRAIYRVAVAIVGTLLVIAGVVTGPLPGPGGIPLVLLGLAVWASEFHWAHRLMLSFKALLHRFRSWNRPRQALFWVVFLLACAALGWLSLIVLGVPSWMPAPVSGWLRTLPGV